MKNPWLKKNPFMSLWLSGANAAAGQVAAAGARQQKAVQRQVTRSWAEAWLAAAKPGKPKRRR